MATPRLTTAVAGSNVTPETKANWMRKYITAKRDVDTYVAMLRNVVKGAKKAGVKTKPMIEAVKDSEMDLPDIITNTREYLQFLSLRNMPVTDQDLFPAADQKEIIAKQRSDDDRAWEAGDAGYEAGKAGRKIEECQHQPGTLEFDAWRRGWGVGQEHLVKSSFGAPEVVASAAKTRRGGKRAAEATPAADEAPSEEPGDAGSR
jgi:ribosome modulation factor